MSLPLFVRTPGQPDQGSTLTILFNLNRLLKDFVSKTVGVCVGVGLHHMNSGEHIQSIATSATPWIYNQRCAHGFVFILPSMAVHMNLGKFLINLPKSQYYHLTDSMEIITHAP